MTTQTPLAAITKSVLSGDTLVLRGPVVQADALPREKVLHLADLTAPRLSSRDRDDEPWAFESRDYLRALVVGKEVSFSLSYTIPTSNLEFGIVYVPSHDGGDDIDVAAELVRAGWAKVRDAPRRDQAGDDENSAATASRRAFLRDLEDEAKVLARGLWSADRPPQRRVDYLMPENPVAFLAQHKGKQIDAIVEGVTNGSQVRARLLLSPEHHQIINLGVAGIRAPRSGNLSGRDDNQTAEEFGDESRFFVESRLLQRLVKVTLLSLPTPAPAPSALNSSAPPAPQQVNLFLGTVHHPAGNIAALLVSVGLARVVDWHAGFLATSPTPSMMSELRRAEADAKQHRRGLFKDLPDPRIAAQQAAASGRSFNAVVTRVWGADMLSIVKDGEQAERRVQLASVRQPRPTDPKLAGLQLEGKELLRKRLIGKPVNVTIDYVKPAEGEYEERECATVRLPSGANIAEYLVERGLLGVLRHKQGDDNRSSDYDRLMAAEARAIEDKKGLHAGKDAPPAPRVVDASESAHKAAPFLSSFKRQGRIAGVVDYVASGSRFKIWCPKQDLKLTLVLAHIRAPRTARNASEKSEPYGPEAAQLSSRRLLQRDVEFSVDATDKSGGFIGRLFYNGQDVATMLVREGLAKVDEYSSSKELWAAQEEAQAARRNIWSSFDPAQAAAANGTGAAAGPVQARKEYLDVVVSEIRGGTETVPFSFSVQVLKDGGIPELEKLMGDLTLFHQSADVTPAGLAPRSGELVSAKFSVDNAWYRAKIRKSNPAKKEAEVVYIDYGNTEVLPYSRLRPLAAQFKALEGQAKDATLSFVSLLDWRTEYAEDAMDRLRELCEGQQLVANVDARDGNALSLSLFDPADPNSLASMGNSINVQLVREGLARIDRRSRLREAHPEVVKALEAASAEARRTRRGAYELGDVLEDD